MSEQPFMPTDKIASFIGRGRRFTPRRIAKKLQTAWRLSVLMRTSPSLYAYILLAQAAAKAPDSFLADVYIAHGVQSLPACAAFARRNNGAIICDCIETPSFADRAIIPTWPTETREFVDHALEGYLRNADQVFTVGWTLAHDLRAINPRVHVLPNYRNPAPFELSDELRSRCGADKGDIILLALNTITSGFEQLLHATAELPDNVHLAVVGAIEPAEYHDTCVRLAQSLGLIKRFHVFAPLAYEKLIQFISGADVGLIILDPEIKNHRVALPNRLFDLLAAELPVVSSQVPDVAKVLHTTGAGTCVAARSAQAWCAAIKTAIADGAQYKSNAIRANASLIWETGMDETFAVLGAPHTATIVSYENPAINNRCNRLKASLENRGALVKYFWRHTDV